MSRNSAIAWACAVGVTLVAGCDFFSPRVAQTPVDSSAVCRTNRQAPDSLFVDLKCSLGALANGEPVYGDILDEEFLFIMDPQDAVSIGPPASWNKSTEFTFLQSANTKLDSVRVTFANTVEGGVGQDAALADTAHWTCDYSIYTSTTSSPDSVEYAGSSDITFRKDSGKGTWLILRWVDHRSTGFRTLGILRRI